jgi:hypothetical protein
MAAKTLGGVILPEQISWKNRFQHTGRIFTPLVSISGATNTTIVVEQAVGTTGRQIELVCEQTGENGEYNDLFFGTASPVGYYGTACQVSSIITLANSGGILTLVWDSETYTVAFAEYPTFEPVVGYATVAEETGNLYTGVIRLVTV